jgi:uncharacterized protein YlxW (UPF0749 family)
MNDDTTKDEQRPEPGPEEPRAEEAAALDAATEPAGAAEPDAAEPDAGEPDAGEPDAAGPGADLDSAEPADLDSAEPATDGATTEPQGIPVVAGRPRRRLLVLSRAHLLVAGLLAVLGFSVVVQARQTQEDGLASLRQSDLVRIFDDLQQRSARLEDESQRLQSLQAELRSGTDRQAAAEQAARERLEVLGILAGTLPATGPGIRLEINDPDRRVSAAMLLDTVQELRDAGAEAIQVGNVRVVASTWFVDGPDGVVVDGRDLAPPYKFTAIGDSATMASALDIPGGVLEIIRSSGARGSVTTSDSLTVSALRQVKAPQYAQPAPARSP